MNHPQRPSSPFTLALGGRSRDKLNEVAISLGSTANSDSIVVVNLLDYSNVESAVVRAKVVINAIGPYWKFGDNVVRACAKHGIHYVDITPEPHFVAHIMERYDYMAFKSNTLIIPACGFDSIPPDIAVFVANRYVKAVLGSEASIEDSVTAYDVKGGFSGGSTGFIMSLVEDVPSQTFTKSVRDYALRHPLGPPSHPGRLVYKLPYDAFSSWWGAVWPPRTINRQTVHHSWSLFERSKDAHPADAYGDRFRYDECMRTRGPIAAFVVSVSILAFVITLLCAPIRWVLKRILPKSGDGPSSDKGHFEVVNITKAGSLTVKTTFRGEGEFAYYATARMVSEAALAILLNFGELPYRRTGGGGVLTPATALGDILIRRLEDFVGVSISSENIKNGETKKTQ